MAWQLSDTYGIEEEIQELGPDVWRIWSDNVLPHLLQDPTRSNPSIKIARTSNDLVWLPGTSVYVRFEVIHDNSYLLLLGVVDLEDLV